MFSCKRFVWFKTKKADLRKNYKFIFSQGNLIRYRRILLIDANVRNEKRNIKLIQRTLKGDQEAFKLLYDQHKRNLFLICLRYSRNRADAEDLMQDAFIQIFRKLSKFDSDKGLFESWSSRVTINVCLQKLRKSSLYAVNISEVVQIEDNTPDAISQLSMQELVEMIQSLPQGYQTIFNLYVIDGFAHKEIAEQLGISESTSKTQLMKARNLLQKKIQDLKGHSIKQQIEEHG